VKMSVFRIRLVCFAACVTTSAMAADNPSNSPANSPEQRLAAAGYRLPNADPPVANYANAVQAGNFLFLAGHTECGRTLKYGKVGAELTVEEGRRSAERVALCMLASAKAAIGDLSRIERFVKIFGMVNGTEDFAESPRVIDGFSNVLTTAFGEGGKAARAAVVMQSLPDRSPVEVEAIALLRSAPARTQMP
jgi:enamine deaminase RidA (YjgF/YER057c/UK114 family)